MFALTMPFFFHRTMISTILQIFRLDLLTDIDRYTGDEFSSSGYCINKAKLHEETTNQCAFIYSVDEHLGINVKDG